MSAITFGGATVETLEFTHSWGLSPASASMLCVGAIAIAVGEDIVLAIGGATYYGVLSSFTIDDTFPGGQKIRIGFVDNRIKLMWDDVYCLFNREEVRADDPSTPGIDRQKRFVHIFPNDWVTQQKTYTTAPLSASDIISELLDADTVEHSWSSSTHSLQSNPVHEIDCLTGKKLGNALQEVSDAQGLVFTLDGSSTLRWALKGDSSNPSYNPASTSDRSIGGALSAVDTRVRVVGDRNRDQVLPIDLEPDWISDYEFFWLEAIWLDEVSGAFGLGNTTFEERATLAAKARTVTLRDYVGVRGDYLADYGMWGEVSRMEIPVWIYLQDIVYKAYRVPLDYTFNGVTLDSLELVEGLLNSVDYGLDGSMSYGDKYYPDAKAFALVKGQQLSLLDPTKQRVISVEELGRAGSEWSPNNRFNLDLRNKVIIFEDAVFIPGTDGLGLFVFLNDGITGLAESLQKIAVPNANVSVEVASVRASLVWDAERYNKDFGSGSRKGPHYASGLSRHELFNDGSSAGEILYADGDSADDKAAKIADSLTAALSAYVSGGFKRIGEAGTYLTSSIDRISVALNFSEGLTEFVEYSKERGQSNFENERDFERKQRGRDLYPGQLANRAEVEKLDLIAKVSKELKRVGTPVYRTIAETMERPIGSVDCSVSKIFSIDTWNAGQPIFLGEDDNPAPEGRRFGGIVIPDQASGLIPCATQGIVPVRTQGPWKTGDGIGINTGSGELPKVGGELPIGVVQSPDYDGTEIVLTMVRLGAGAGAQFHFPWEITRFEDPPASGDFFARLRPGTISGLLPTNMFDAFATALATRNWVVLNCNTDGVNVTSCALAVVSTQPTMVTATSNIAPSNFLVLIGTIEADGSIVQLQNTLLNAVPVVVFIEPTTAALGQEPFVRSWNWLVTSQ